MGKKIETKINRFDGGVLSDRRTKSSNGFSVTKHFDIFSNPNRLTPYRDFTANENKTYDIVKFIQTNSNIYGFGVVPGGAIAKIYKKSGDIITSSWTEDQAVNGSGARNEKVFFEYKNYLYFWEGGTSLTRHGDITGTATVATYQTISYTDVAQPVRHPADDNAYFFADNNIYRLNNTTWDGLVQSVPNNFIITSATAYGNYLAVGCKDKDATGNSVVFLWDRDSSITTFTEQIDWGSGTLEVLEIIDGILVGISNTGQGSSFSILPKIHIKALLGGSVQILKEIDVDSTTTGDTEYRVTGDSRVVNNKLYFAVHSGSSTNDRAYTGIWVFGKNELGSYVVTMPYKITTDANTPSDTIQGFELFQDYLFVAHSNDGSVDRTNDQASYTITSIYESRIFNQDDSAEVKKLIGATVSTVSLPTAGQIVLKYLKDEDIDGQDWASTATTIFTNTTDNSISNSAIRDASGAILPQYKEIQFRIESTGGAEITGLKFKEEIIENDKY